MSKRFALFILGLILGLRSFAQVIPNGPLQAPGATSTIVGSLQTATGGTIANGTLNFSLSQPAVVSGTSSVAVSSVSCYTSTAGNVVGVPDPLVPPALSTNTASGSLPAGTYYVKYLYVATAGISAGASVPSPESIVVLSAQGSVSVNPPGFHPGSVGFFAVYISTISGAETFQGTSNGWAVFTQSAPLGGGSGLPIGNTSACNIYFSDQLVPTGTFYTVTLLNQNGSRISGFPQTWCTFGGAGGTINVSQGAPTGNCGTNGVFYPTPIYATPQNNSAQSVSGPISFPGGVTGNTTFSGNNFFSGNNSFSGTSSLRGLVTTCSLNGEISTSCSVSPTIAAAIAACPAAPTACRINVSIGTYAPAGFTLGVSPCQSGYAQYMTVGIGAVITTTAKINLLCSGYLNGVTRDGSTLKADPAFPTSTPLVDMGDNAQLIDAQLTNLSVNCNNVVGCTGVRARGMNENTLISQNVFQNFKVTGISIDGSTVNTANFIVSDNAFSPAAGISGDLISVVSVGAITFLRNSLTSGTAQTGAGIHFSGTGGTIQAPSVLNGNSHCEKMTDCLLVDGKANIVALGLDGEASTANTLHIAATATGQVEVMNLYNNGNAACPGSCVVKNDVTGTQLASTNPPAPNGAIHNYFWQNNNCETWIDTQVHLCKTVVSTGLSADGSGFKHKRFASPLGGTCPTGAAIGNACTSANLNWTTAFADNNYSVSCTLTGVTNQPHIVGYTKQAAGAGITITIATDLASAANAGADCIAIHD